MSILFTDGDLSAETNPLQLGHELLCNHIWTVSVKHLSESLGKSDSIDISLL